MSAARLAARVAELLGPASGAVVVVAAPPLAAALASRVALAGDGRPAWGAVVSFLGEPVRPADRQRALHALRARVGEGGPVVVVDHNQPRAVWRRALAFGPLLVAGLRPARARYPAARELAALGFAVERLRLAAGERVQLVRARA